MLYSLHFRCLLYSAHTVFSLPGNFSCFLEFLAKRLGVSLKKALLGTKRGEIKAEAAYSAISLSR